MTIHFSIDIDQIAYHYLDFANTFGPAAQVATNNIPQSQSQSQSSKRPAGDSRHESGPGAL